MNRNKNCQKQKSSFADNLKIIPKEINEIIKNIN